MIDQQAFLEKYRIGTEAFESANVDWAQLLSIHKDYANAQQDIESAGLYIADRLRKLDAVHSLRIRLKDPEHLIEKIIRKASEDNSLEINPDNYRDKITDLIGVRALHLFKEDWASIHDIIIGNWDLHEKPTANVRKGDHEEFIEKFKERGCNIHEHKFGYRSVHYIVKSQPGKQLHLAEIQVRTIFEEGFSEIDHQVRYPYYQDNLMLASYLAIFNRLAGSADEMGSFVKTLKEELDAYEEKTEELIREREELTDRLKEHVTKLKIEKKEKDKLKKDLDKLSYLKFDPLASSLSTQLGLTTESIDLTAGGLLGRDIITKPSGMLAIKMPESILSLSGLYRTEPKEPKEELKTKKKKAKRKPKKE